MKVIANPVKVGAGTAIGGVSAYFILSSINLSAWDELVRNMIKALFQRNGPLAGLLVVVFLSLLALIFSGVHVIIKSKNEEINRLVAWRDKYEERLGIGHPSSEHIEGGK